MPAHPFNVIAHRGDKVHAPENTLPAFEAALALGADGIELDVRLTRDGVPAIVHDKDLKRVGGVEWVVEETEWSALRDVPVGERFGPGFPGARVPRLEEVLERFAARIPLELELKAGAAAPAVVAALRTLGNSEARAKVIVTSFEPEWLAEVHRLDPEQRVAWLSRRETTEHWGPLERTGAWGWYPHLSELTPERLAEARRRGLAVRAWGVKDLAAARAAYALGAEGCTYDDPGELIAFLKREKLRA
ncbi:MAG: glycerophosphodiester phosphodiesterase [Planctomycetota bacterium]|nr:glycerophosphodiester phosphodiesterase [Planctomycetota bacterium]